MGNEPESQTDSKFFTEVPFKLNLLVCGDYNEVSIEFHLQNVKSERNFKGVPGKYLKHGVHINMKDWTYYFFGKDNNIGLNTYDFIYNQIVEKKNQSNLILFYSGLSNFSAQELIDYYDKIPGIYHPYIIIVTSKTENFIPKCKKMDPSNIRVLEEGNIIGLLVNIIEVCSYYNQLGDEIGFPKLIVNKNLMDKDTKLMAKDLFTINCIVCGKPGAGKSTFINKILGKTKCYASKGNDTVTSRVVKYIHDELPLVLYDTPGFLNPEDIDTVEALIKDKNKLLQEQKNKIHCVFYLLNTGAERTFIKNEFPFIETLLQQNMDIYFIATHAQNKENSENYIEATKIALLREFKNNFSFKSNQIKERIYPVELIDNNEYKKFGLTELFTDLYKKYENEKITEEINKKNIMKINSKFLNGIKSENDIICYVTSLSRRILSNFELLASTIGTNKGSTMLSTAVIKIISKIYNKSITSDECVNYIKLQGYTNELVDNDTFGRKIEKLFAGIKYKYGPAASEIRYLGEKKIKEYNEELTQNKYKLYEYINILRKEINNAVDSLKNIHD